MIFAKKRLFDETIRKIPGNQCEDYRYRHSWPEPVSDSVDHDLLDGKSVNVDAIRNVEFSINQLFTERLAHHGNVD